LPTEPTTALDVTIQAQILELIGTLRREFNAAVLLITHDMGVVAGVSDRIVVMYAGKVAETATTDELFANPRHPYTLGLLNSIPRLDAQRRERLVPIEGLPPDLITLPAICSFSARCSFALERCREGVPELREVAPAHRRCLQPRDHPCRRSHKRLGKHAGTCRRLSRGSTSNGHH